MKKSNLINIGKEFNNWTYIGGLIKKNKVTFLYCKCRCGLEKFVSYPSLRQGLSKQCRECSNKDYKLKNIDLEIGTKFGNRLYLGKWKQKGSHVYILVKCICEKEDFVNLTLLKRNIGLNCSKCAAKFLKKHGMTKTSTYISWASMLTRCYNFNNKAFKYYGEKGIKVCERWLISFENFLEDMGEMPKGFSIERIDVNKNYSCGKCEECLKNNWIGNCKWIPKQDQPKNRTNTVYVFINDKKFLLTEALKFFNLSNTSLRRIMVLGKNHQEAISELLNKKLKKKLSINEEIIYKVLHHIKNGETIKSMATKLNVSYSTLKKRLRNVK